MHRSPFRKLTRQHPPLAATLEQIQHAAEYFVQIHCPRLRLLAYAFQQRPDLFERFLADVTGVSLPHAPVYDIQLIVNSLLDEGKKGRQCGEGFAVGSQIVEIPVVAPSSDVHRPEGDTVR